MGNDDGRPVSLCCLVADLACGISVLWPSLWYLAEPPSDMNTLTVQHLSYVWCIIDYCGSIRLNMCHSQMYHTGSIAAFSIRTNCLFAGIYRIHTALLIYLCTVHTFHISFLISVEATYCHTSDKAEIAMHNRRATEQSHFKACLKNMTQ